MQALLASGQIPPRVRLNLAQLTAQQLQIQPKSSPVGILEDADVVQAGLKADVVSSSAQYVIGNPADDSNVKYVDSTETHILFKRAANSTKSKTMTKRATTLAEKSEKRKRGLLMLSNGDLIDESLLKGDNAVKLEGLTVFGVVDKNELNAPRSIFPEEETENSKEEEDKEAAEDEVKAVMALCSLCDGEPFQGAIVYAWKNQANKYTNVLKGLSVGRCGDF